MICPNCNKNEITNTSDYICNSCRVEIALSDLDRDATDKDYRYIMLATHLWPGWVMTRTLEHWTEIRLVERESSSNAFAMSITYRTGYAIWSETGDIYRLSKIDGSVEDDPISEADFVAALCGADGHVFDSF